MYGPSYSLADDEPEPAKRDGDEPEPDTIFGMAGEVAYVSMLAGHVGGRGRVDDARGLVARPHERISTTNLGHVCISPPITLRRGV
jgi:hypothetical protein